jgi:N-acetylneuraminic acid mutarotase
LSCLNQKRYSFAAVVFDNKIYSIGGMVQLAEGNKNINQYSRYLELMEVFDVSNKTWTTSSKNMRNRCCGCSAVVMGRTIMVVGGCDERSTINAVESFDVSTHQWRGGIIPHLRIKEMNLL